MEKLVISWEGTKKTDFSIGKLYITRGAAVLAEEKPNFGSFLKDCLCRYLACDWGDTCPEDRAANNDALINGERILAEYQESQHPEWRIWIITEWDRSATTILFPDEY